MSEKRGKGRPPVYKFARQQLNVTISVETRALLDELRTETGRYLGRLVDDAIAHHHALHNIKLCKRCRTKAGLGE